MLSILNSLAEYFHMINGLLPMSENPEIIEQKALYVIFNGKMPGLYISFEELVIQKKDVELEGGLSWKRYTSIDEALNQARRILGVNYYLEPSAKEYIQKYRKAKGMKTLIVLPGLKIRDDRPSRKPTYKESLIKGIDPLDGEYIDFKLKKKFETISPQWKKDIKE
uniref:Uncharacterized protein n=1 Tax=Arundo donax TaxID=35708 RepID=A0A0A9G5S1_ARUDO